MNKLMIIIFFFLIYLTSCKNEIKIEILKFEKNNCDEINSKNNNLQIYAQNKLIIDSLWLSYKSVKFNENLFDTCDCVKGILNAIIDFNSGEFGYYFYSFPYNYFNTYMRILTEKYDIKVKGGGDRICDCIGSCYNLFMDFKLEQKYGKDFYKNVKKECDSLYEIGLGDRDVEYEGGYYELYKFIYSKLNISEIQIKNNPSKININLIIDTLGKIKKIEYNDSCSLDIENKINNTLNLLTKWKPAVYDKKKYESNFGLIIKLNKNEQNEYLEMIKK